MKASELQKILTGYIERGHADDDVVIQCKEPSVGASASVGIQEVSAGFDWNNGRLIVEPDQPVLHLDKDRDASIPAIRINYKNNYGGKIKPTLHCPKCEEKIHKDTLYCPRCGQRVDTVNVRDVTL